MNSCDSKEGERGGIITNLIVLLFFVIFCAVLYLARHPILRFAAEFWIIDCSGRGRPRWSWRAEDAYGPARGSRN